MPNIEYEIKYSDDNIPYVSILNNDLELEDKFAIIELATGLVTASYIKNTGKFSEEKYSKHLASLENTIRHLNGLALSLGEMVSERDKGMDDLLNDLGLKKPDND